MTTSNIDYEKTSIRKLFIKQLVPSILAMAFTALFVITDGIFVGRGIGSDALAAVNIIAPLFSIMTGIGLMYGMGAAILSSILLSKNKKKDAQVIITQSFISSSLIMILFSIIAVCHPTSIATILGAPQAILTMATEYLIFLSSFSVFQTAICSLPFFVRINHPNYSLLCLSTATIINIVLDYLFIFTFEWGLKGAAIATGIGQVAATTMLLIYLTRKNKELRLIKLQISLKKIGYALRNNVKIIRLGFAILLSEITIAAMSITGNYTFNHYTGVAGVAAFSIINYLFPIVYMIYNAIIQSAQPIISYNYGQNNKRRYLTTLRWAIGTATIAGAILTLISTSFSQQLTSLFIPDNTDPAWDIAKKGLPIFSIDFLFFGINIVVIGYYMAIENTKKAMKFTIIRGILPIIYFAIIPTVLNVEGIWLSVPLAEITTSIIILIDSRSHKPRKKLNTLIYSQNTTQ